MNYCTCSIRLCLELSVVWDFKKKKLETFAFGFIWVICIRFRCRCKNNFIKKVEQRFSGIKIAEKENKKTQFCKCFVCKSPSLQLFVDKRQETREYRRNHWLNTDDFCFAQKNKYTKMAEDFDIEALLEAPYNVSIILNDAFFFSLHKIISDTYNLCE